MINWRNMLDKEQKEVVFKTSEDRQLMIRMVGYDANLKTNTIEPCVSYMSGYYCHDYDEEDGGIKEWIELAEDAIIELSVGGLERYHWCYYDEFVDEMKKIEKIEDVPMEELWTTKVEDGNITMSYVCPVCGCLIQKTTPEVHSGIRMNELLADWLMRNIGKHMAYTHDGQAKQ